LSVVDFIPRTENKKNHLLTAATMPQLIERTKRSSASINRKKKSKSGRNFFSH